MPFPENNILVTVYLWTHDMDDLNTRKLAYNYMENSFPFDLVFRLLNAFGMSLHRRTAMTAPARDRPWVEKLGASSARKLRDVVCGMASTPSSILARGTSIHIGPGVGPRPPLYEHHSTFEEMRASTNCVELWRDFVIDIDLDDYDDATNVAVRFCACSGKKKSCPVCWCYIQAAHAFLSWRLQNRFGIHPESMLWVKSGNKGAHCWIGLSRLARLDRNLRSLVMDQLVALPESLETEEEKEDIRMLVKNALTPLLNSKLRDGRFRKLLKDIVGDKFGILAGDIPDDVESALGLYRWLRKQQGVHWANEVKLYLLAVLTKPRYDKAVIADAGHCTKVPFSINSSTLRVSVPIVDIRNTKKPPLVKQVVQDPTLINPEIALFEKWIGGYIENE